MGILDSIFKSRKVPQIQGVNFKEKEVTDGNTYEVYVAPNQARALEFLRAIDVNEERRYVIVETPSGNFGKDLIMIFDEGSSARIEYGVRRPLPKVAKSRTHCSRCGYPVLPAGHAIPGAIDLILLGQVKEKGGGFSCSGCGAAWCSFCVPEEAPGKCQLCGHDMELYRK
jgi:hypothetical protein